MLSCVIGESSPARNFKYGVFVSLSTFSQFVAQQWHVTVTVTVPSLVILSQLEMVCKFRRLHTETTNRGGTGVWDQPDIFVYEEEPSFSP